ncbi:MAG TPA: Cof-type HAD-IIB family hydrolase [Aggregatilinea sp.]|uniref:Cof-type HAD-IIB family hydrolase n=1 Tax=Aggregatilinea sp. TaxID=2806333 RepID=UPI002BD842EE|nr:Cof-type HAD-IIB family hydrolase [Aggregatilinea sp.]HML20435.1 Cof-type HAD-IIB family hydrolase [Aggregatilinea sp.]
MPDTSQPKIRLIVSDLDGTLLNTAHQIGPATDEAVQEAVRQGVLFTVATGKTFPSTQGVIDRYGISIPVITNNGTVLNDTDGSVIWDHPIPLDIALESIELARHEGILPIVYAGPELIVAPLNGSRDAIDRNMSILMAHYEPAPHIVDDLTQALRSDFKPHKIIFMNADDLDGVAAFQTTLANTFAGRADVMRSGLVSLFEILPHSVSKENALAVMLDRMGIAPEQTMAMGDNSNDLGMIRMAGLGVAMGQSPDIVRRDADYVTGTNDEDGVGHAIHELVLTPSMANRP